MKYVSLVLALAIGDAMFGGTNEIARIRSLISQAQSQFHPSAAGDPEAIVDSYQVHNLKPECLALQEKMAESWPFVLQHLKEVAPTDSAKALALISFGKMTPRSYLAFLDALAGLVESGTLDRKYFLWAQFPPEGELSIFKQSAEPKARAVLLRARKIFQDLPDKTHLYDSMLTGEVKKSLEDDTSAGFWTWYWLGASVLVLVAVIGWLWLRKSH
jgi:hypothetical protein